MDVSLFQKWQKCSFKPNSTQTWDAFCQQSLSYHLILFWSHTFKCNKSLLIIWIKWIKGHRSFHDNTNKQAHTCKMQCAAVDIDSQIILLVLITNTAKFFQSPFNSTSPVQKLVWFFMSRKHSEACHYYVIKFCLSLHISLGQNAENRHFLKSQQIETDYLWSEINAAWQKMSSKILWWHYLCLHISGRQHNEKHKHNPVYICKENIEAHSVSIFPWIFFYGEPLWSVSPSLNKLKPQGRNTVVIHIMNCWDTSKASQQSESVRKDQFAFTYFSTNLFAPLSFIFIERPLSLVLLN